MGYSAALRPFWLAFVTAPLLFAASAFAQTQAEPQTLSAPGQGIPGTTGVSPFGGSVPSKPVPGILPLSLQDAINRGLRQNLGALLADADIVAARGQRWQALSALLPHVTAAPYVEQSQINLAELGLSGNNIPFPVPTSIGPFSYFDARLAVTQTIFDWKSINNARSASQSLKSSEYTYKDARDLVVLAVGGAYVQVIAAQARVASARAQLDTANALFQQASERRSVGLVAQIDVNRSQVQALDVSLPSDRV